MTDRIEEAGSRTKRIAPDGSRAVRLGSSPGELMDRLEKLRILLPAFAQEAAAARRETARLRSQNRRLQRRVDELEASFDIAREPRSRDA